MRKKPAVTINALRDAGATVISLAKDPYNLRVASDVVTATLKARHKATGQHVTAVYGEQHRVTKHVMLPLFTLSDLAKENPAKVISCHEYQHNYVDDLRALYRDTFKTEPPPIKGDEGQYALMLRQQLGIILEDAPLANELYFGICVKHNLRVRFADAARTSCDQFIDPNDPVNAELLAMMPPSINRRQSVSSDCGMALRNLCMATKAFQLATGKPKASYTVMRCGATHLFGEPPANDYYDSLAHYLTMTGLNVVYVLPMGKGIRETHLPPEITQHAKDLIIVTGHEERRFTHRDNHKERDHLNAISVASGLITREQLAAIQEQRGLAVR